VNTPMALRKIADCGLRIAEFGLNCGACSAPCIRISIPARRDSTIAYSSDAADENTPKGFRSHSPGLPGTPGNPGCDAQRNINPERVALAGVPDHSIELNPFRVRASLWASTQGCPTKVGQPWAVLRNAFSVPLRIALSELCCALQMSQFASNRGACSARRIRRSTFDVRCSTFADSSELVDETTSTRLENPLHHRGGRT